MRSIAISILWSAAVLMAAEPSGEAVYKTRCAACHDANDPKIPPSSALRKLPAARILRTLDTGIMMSVAAPMKKDEREAVAKFLGTSAPDMALGPQAFCRDRKVTVRDNTKFIANGWSSSPTNMRYQTAEAAGLSIEQVKNLKLKWAFGFDGDITAFSQPAVFDDQVFVGSSAGVVYALRADSGCIQWLFQSSASIRTAMTVAPLGNNRHAVVFGDQTAWAYALEAETGRLLWRKKVDDHETARITGAPSVHDGNVYVPVASWEETAATRADYPCCSFRGSVVALRLRDGQQIWKTYVIADTAKPQRKTPEGRQLWGPSGIGIWSAPTLDIKRKVLYVTTGNNYSDPDTEYSDSVISMDMASGRILWSRQVTPKDVFSGCGACATERGPDFDFGSSAILLDGILVAGQKSGVVYGLDPDRKGEIRWQTRIAQGSSHGGVQWGMASDGRLVYAPIADGALLRLPVNGGPPQPFMETEGGGGLAALRVADGSIAWKAAPVPLCKGVLGCSPAQLAAASAIPGAVFSGALDGHLRAYAAEDGKILWDFATAREFETVNGVKAKGGAMNGPGAVVVNGRVLVNSGYDHFGSLNGNVLLMFAP